jgi:hypothetical protein
VLDPAHVDDDGDAEDHREDEQDEQDLVGEHPPRHPDQHPPAVVDLVVHIEDLGGRIGRVRRFRNWECVFGLCSFIGVKLLTCNYVSQLCLAMHEVYGEFIWLILTFVEFYEPRKQQF